MARRLTDIIRLADSYGFHLHRHSKHLIFRGPQGQQVVASSSPTDKRTMRNVESEFRRALAREA